MLKALGRVIAHHICFPLFLCLNFFILSPILFGGEWIANQLEADKYLRVCCWIIRLFLLCLFFAGLYVSFSMSHYLADEGYMFIDSFKTAWVNLWFSLSFLPLIGHLFERPPNPRDALNDDDDV